MQPEVPIPGEVEANKVTEKRVYVERQEDGYTVRFGGFEFEVDALNMNCPVALTDGTLEFGGIHRIQVAVTQTSTTRFAYIEVQ